MPKDPTHAGLIRATELLRAEAITLTREEIGLTYPTGVLRLYGSRNVSKSTEAIFQGLVVEPCRGVFKSLR